MSTVADVSVIVPTYNRAGCVLDAVHSVLGQRRPPAQVIVVDDGSTDDTLRVLAAVADCITYVRQDNRGVSAARNAGLARARASWVAFLDSDDCWDEAYLERQLRSADEHPAAVAHILDALVVDRQGASVRHFEQIGIAASFAGEGSRVVQRALAPILRSAYWYVQTAMVRRDIALDCGGFDARLRIAEDLEFLAKVALRGAVSFTALPLARIRQCGIGAMNLSEASQRDRVARLEGYVRAYRNLLAQPALAPRERAAVRGGLASSLRGLGNACLVRDDRRGARQAYRAALGAEPSLRALAKFAMTGLPKSWLRLAVNADERRLRRRYG